MKDDFKTERGRKEVDTPLNFITCFDGLSFYGSWHYNIKLNLNFRQIQQMRDVWISVVIFVVGIDPVKGSILVLRILVNVRYSVYYYTIFGRGLALRVL